MPRERRATCCKVRQRTVTPPGRPMPGSIPGSPTISHHWVDRSSPPSDGRTKRPNARRFGSGTRPCQDGVAQRRVAFRGTNGLREVSGAVRARLLGPSFGPCQAGQRCTVASAFQGTRIAWLGAFGRSNHRSIPGGFGPGATVSQFCAQTRGMAAFAAKTAAFTLAWPPGSNLAANLLSRSRETLPVPRPRFP